MKLQKLVWALVPAMIPNLVVANTGDLISSNGIQQGSTFYSKGGSYVVVPGQGIRLSLARQYSTFGLNLGDVNWSQYTHLYLTIRNNAAASTMVQVAFDSGTNGWAWSDFVIAGGSTVNISVPLQKGAMNGWVNSPTGNGFASQAPFYGTLDKTDVRLVRVWNPMRASSQDLSVLQLTPEAFAMPFSALIDKYGQPTDAFTGKITSDGQLAQQALADAQLSGVLPYSSDSWGGVAGSSQGAGNGKWHVEKQNGRWYIIAPNGDRFFSTGIDCVGNGSTAYMFNHSLLFGGGALPAQGDPLAAMYTTGVNPSTGLPEPGYNFYQANLLRKYGASYAGQALSNNVRRLRTWGFNTVGPSSSPLYYDASNQMANMQQTGIQGSYRTISCPGGSFAMPDVYDRAWADAVATSLTPVVAKLNQDPYNVGLFVDNELPWAQHWNEPNYRYDLAYNVLSAPADQPAKQRFYSLVLMKYRTIQRLNTAWGTSYDSWTTFLNTSSFRPASPTFSLRTDMSVFIQQMANMYFSTIKQRLSMLGYHGLYLGCRFAFYAPEVIQAAARYCDVVSFNAYDVFPSQWRYELKALDAPVLISEFGFAASDLGRIGGASTCTATESDRAMAYQSYVNDAESWPNLVGIHWYKWDDEPVTGRMWDNSNQTMGVVSITDVPYGPLVSAMTSANTYLNQRLVNP